MFDEYLIRHKRGIFYKKSIETETELKDKEGDGDSERTEQTKGLMKAKIKKN